MSRTEPRVYGTLMTPSGLNSVVEIFTREGVEIIVSNSAQLVNSLQRALPSAGSEEEPSGIQVVPLSQFVLQMSRQVGADQFRPLADSETIFEAAKLSLQTLSSEGPIGKVNGFSGVKRRIGPLILEMISEGIVSEDLRRVSDAVEAPFSEKLADLALVLEGTEQHLTRIGAEIEARLIERCLEAQVLGAEISKVAFVFQGRLSKPLKNWLKWFLNRQPESCVVLEKHPETETVFQFSSEIEQFLDLKSNSIGEASDFVRGVFGMPRAECPIDVQIQSAGDMLTEVEACLREVRLKRASGGRSSCLIFARDIESYGPLLSLIAERFDLPVSIKVPTHLSDVPWIADAIRLLNAVRNREIHELFSAIKRGPLLNSSGQLELVRSTLDSVLALPDASFSDAVHALSSHEDFAPILPWIQPALWEQERLMSPLAWLSLLKNWLRQEQLVECLNHPDSSSARDRLAEEAWISGITRRALLQSEVTDQSLSDAISDWVEAAQTHMLQVELGNLESKSVPVISHLEGATSADHVFALGLVEGAFPRRRTEDSLLGDEERNQLSLLIDTDPHLILSSNVAAAERDVFVRLCAAAHQSLTLSYPIVDEDRARVPASYLAEAERAAGKRVVKHHNSIEHVVPLRSELATEHDVELRYALENSELMTRQEAVSNSTAGAVRWNGVQPMTPSELRDAYECPFRYAVRTFLGVKPPFRGSSSLPIARLMNETRLAENPDQCAAERKLLVSLDRTLETQRIGAQHDDHILLQSWAKRAAQVVTQSEFDARKLWPRTAEAFDRTAEAEVKPEQMESSLNRLTISATVASIGRKGIFNIAKVYGLRRSIASGSAKTMSSADQLELAAYMGVIRAPNTIAALEACSTGDERTLYLKATDPSERFESDREKGLNVVDLRELDREFFKKAKDLLFEAAERARSHQMEAVPGDYCSFCDFGELCRRSRAFTNSADGIEIPVEVKTNE